MAVTSVGFDSFIGQKVDYQDHDLRAASQRLEFEWTPDSLNRPNISLFGHLLYSNTMGYSYDLPDVVDVSCVSLGKHFG